jgi:sec-independent protein translocase protein TatC
MPRRRSLRQAKTAVPRRVGHVGGVTAGTIDTTPLEGAPAMSRGLTKFPDPDDYFSETRMSFGDHLEDLRTHLWRAIYGFSIALIVGFFVGYPLLHIMCAPVEAQLQIYWDRYYENKGKQVLAELADGERDGGQPIPITMHLNEKAVQDLGLKVQGPIDVGVVLRDPLPLAVGLKKMETVVGRRPSLSTLRVQESFLVYMEVSLVAGLVLASPWIFYQVWSFIAAGLYPHEKRHVNLFLPISIGLFLAGVALCQIFVLPTAVGALLWFNEWLGFEPDLRLSDWLGFALLMPIIFGLCFQTPLVMLFVERIGIMSVESFRRRRGIAWFLMCAFAVIILPTYDIPSLLFLWLPMGFLYELGILMCVWSPKRPAFDDVEESDQLIEV